MANMNITTRLARKQFVAAHLSRYNKTLIACVLFFLLIRGFLFVCGQAKMHNERVRFLKSFTMFVRQQL